MKRFRSGWNSATIDNATFKAWEKGEIVETQAIKRLKNNNGWDELTHEEFIEMAKSFGYRKER